MVVARRFAGRRFWLTVSAAIIALGLTAAAQGVRAQTADEHDGLFLTVPNPLDGQFDRIKGTIDEALRKGRKLQTIVFDFNPRGLPAGTTNFGPCKDLADYIHGLRLGQFQRPIKTIAFVHNRVSKHTVLPVLACDQLVMSDEMDPATRQSKARIGDVREGSEVPLDQSARTAYEKVAQNFASRALVFRMIDRNLVIRKVTTRDGAVLYLDDDELAKRPDKADLAVAAGIPPGLDPGTGTFDAEKARQYGLCKAIYNSRIELARALRLPRRALSEDWLMGRAVVPWLIEVKGTLDSGKIDSLQRRIDRARGYNANLILLHLDCEGGETASAYSLARDLSKLSDDRGQLPIKTVAWIPPGRALGAATFLAVGCNELVMGKDSVLGDFDYLNELQAKKPQERAEIIERLTKELKPKREMLVQLAKDQGYPPALFEAMLDWNITLYRVRSKLDATDLRVVTEEQYNEDAKSKVPQWFNEGRLDKPEGQFFKLTAREAKILRLVDNIEVNSLDDLYALYNLEASKVQVARDDWLDMMAEFFRQPVVQLALIMVGIIGMILEMKVPGTALPGIIAAICFILFFWAHSFIGQYTLLAVLLFVLGVICIGVEVFVFPGFGVPGISGILLIVGSLVLVTLEKMPVTTEDWFNLGFKVTTFGAGMVGAVGAAIFLAWYLPNIPYANRLVLKPPGETLLPEGESAFASFLGAIGVAETSLRPAGKARFGDDFLDVIAEGDFVNPGARVQVIEVEGTRVVVKEIYN